MSDVETPAGQTIDRNEQRAVESFRGTELDFSDWRVVRETARVDPLAHPLAFSMGPVRFDYPTPPHLISLYCDLYRATMPAYTDAPKQLVRLMPRDHGKSVAASVVFPTWLALTQPNVNILIMMHKEAKAAGKLQQCRDYIEDLGPVFGRRITRSNRTELTLERTESSDVPTIHAAGFKSGVTGGHYDVVLMDDVVTWDTQNTEGQRQKAKRKFQNYLNLGDEGETTYVVLGTRKHRDDLYGWLLGKPEWDSEVKRALADMSVIEEGDFKLVTDSGNTYPANRHNSLPPNETLVGAEPHRDGGALWPERYDTADLIYEYLSAGESGDSGVGSSAEWVREKQNQPDTFEGQILDRGMIAFAQPGENGVRNAIERDLVNFVALDPAIESDPEKAASNDTDYWAIAVLGYDQRTETAYLRDVYRTRGQTANEAVSWTRRTLGGYDYQPLYIEATQGQEFLAQAFTDAGIDCRRVTPTREKEDRIISSSALFENGTVRILGDPSAKKWQSFITEWTGFPNADHDDRLDAVAAAISLLQKWQNSPRSGFNL